MAMMFTAGLALCEPTLTLWELEYSDIQACVLSQLDWDLGDPWQVLIPK